VGDDHQQHPPQALQEACRPKNTLSFSTDSPQIKMENNTGRKSSCYFSCILVAVENLHVAESSTFYQADPPFSTL
jgi:hypothetical protein